MPIAMAGCCPWAIAKDVTTPAPIAAGMATSSKERSDLFLYITLTTQFVKSKLRDL